MNPFSRILEGAKAESADFMENVAAKRSGGKIVDNSSIPRRAASVIKDGFFGAGTSTTQNVIGGVGIGAAALGIGYGVSQSNNPAAVMGSGAAVMAGALALARPNMVGMMMGAEKGIAEKIVADAGTISHAVGAGSHDFVNTATQAANPGFIARAKERIANKLNQFFPEDRAGFTGSHGMVSDPDVHPDIDKAVSTNNQKALPAPAIPLGQLPNPFGVIENKKIPRSQIILSEKKSNLSDSGRYRPKMKTPDFGPVSMGHYSDFPIGDDTVFSQVKGGVINEINGNLHSLLEDYHKSERDFAYQSLQNKRMKTQRLGKRKSQEL